MNVNFQSVNITQSSHSRPLWLVIPYNKAASTCDCSSQVIFLLQATVLSTLTKGWSFFLLGLSGNNVKHKYLVTPQSFSSLIPLKHPDPQVVNR